MVSQFGWIIEIIISVLDSQHTTVVIKTTQLRWYGDHLEANIVVNYDCGSVIFKSYRNNYTNWANMYSQYCIILVAVGVLDVCGSNVDRIRVVWSKNNDLNSQVTMMFFPSSLQCGSYQHNDVVASQHENNDFGYPTTLYQNSSFERKTQKISEICNISW